MGGPAGRGRLIEYIAAKPEALIGIAALEDNRRRARLAARRE
jgi:hypothetical protein